MKELTGQEGRPGRTVQVRPGGRQGQVLPDLSAPGGTDKSGGMLREDMVGQEGCSGMT